MDPAPQALNSEVIASVSWDQYSGMLIVRFRNGTRYLYEGVPRNVYEGFFAAQSAGKYFNQHVSRKYKSRKL